MFWIQKTNKKSNQKMFFIEKTDTQTTEKIFLPL